MLWNRSMRAVALWGVVVAVSVAVLGVLLFPRFHAAAAAPIFRVRPVDVTFPLPGVTAVCGFPVNDHVQGTIRKIIRQQPSGAFIITTVESQEFTETLVAPSTGRSLVGHLVGPDIVTLNPDGSATIVDSGNFDLYVAPGQGVIAQAAGHFVIEVPVDGDPIVTFRGLDAGTIDSAAICDALSG
jgi:hypothetical protein